MPSTVHLGIHYQTVLAPDIESADPFWTIDLVSRERQQIDSHFFYIDWDLAEALGSIGMDYYTSLSTESSDAGNVANAA